jgi:hypothetical protein
MILGQEVMERTNSPTFCRRSTDYDSFSTDKYGRIFHSFNAWYNFWNAFSSETAANHSLKNNALRSQKFKFMAMLPWWHDS